MTLKNYSTNFSWNCSTGIKKIINNRRAKGNVKVKRRAFVEILGNGPIHLFLYLIYFKNIVYIQSA